MASPGSPPGGIVSAEPAGLVRGTPALPVLGDCSQMGLSPVRSRWSVRVGVQGPCARPRLPSAGRKPSAGGQEGKARLQRDRGRVRKRGQ